MNIIYYSKKYHHELNLNNKILDVGCSHYINLYLFYKLGFKNLYRIDKLDLNPDTKPKKFNVNFIKHDINYGLPYKK